MKHQISVSCKVIKADSTDSDFEAKTAWLKKNKYRYNGENHYWTKFYPSRDGALNDFKKFREWSEWAIYISPVR